MQDKAIAFLKQLPKVLKGWGEELSIIAQCELRRLLISRNTKRNICRFGINGTPRMKWLLTVLLLDSRVTSNKCLKWISMLGIWKSLLWLLPWIDPSRWFKLKVRFTLSIPVVPTEGSIFSTGVLITSYLNALLRPSLLSTPKLCPAKTSGGRESSNRGGGKAPSLGGHTAAGRSLGGHTAVTRSSQRVVQTQKKALGSRASGQAAGSIGGLTRRSFVTSKGQKKTALSGY